MSIGNATEQALAARFPAVWEAACASPPLRVEVSASTPARTLIVEGLHVTSAYDRDAEARVQASRVPEDARVAAVYGEAPGDLSAALLARPSIERVRAVVTSPALLRAWAAHSSSASWMEDPRAEVVLARDERELVRPFGVVPAGIALAEPGASEVRNAVLLALEEARTRGDAAREHAIADALARNERRLVGDGDVATVAGAKRGAFGIAVTSGTLDAREIEWIRGQRRGAVIVAAADALAVLVRASLPPDFVVAIEPLEGTHALAGVDIVLLGRPTLVYAPWIDPSTVDAWPGPRLVAWVDNDRLAPLRRKWPRTASRLAASECATVDLALRLGAERVVLAGARFCSDGEPTAKLGLRSLDVTGAARPITAEKLRAKLELEAFAAGPGRGRITRILDAGVALAGITVTP